MTPAPTHGGNLEAAIRRFGGAPSDWLDLSTGINPRPYPCTPLTAAMLHRLPETPEALEAVARSYYDVSDVVAVPGSQWAITELPRLVPPGRVMVHFPGYAEHGFRWQAAGHEVVTCAAEATVDELMAMAERWRASAIVLVNPNNPGGGCIADEDMERLVPACQAAGRLLVIDEAFMDVHRGAVPAALQAPGVLVLRSFGKFFGLAGVRLGFVTGDTALCEALRACRGPWALTTAALVTGLEALSDTSWQRRMRLQLGEWSRAQSGAWQRLWQHEAVDIRSSVLFTTARLATARAWGWQSALAAQRIWVRCWPVDEHTALLRAGLIDPACGLQQDHFHAALATLKHDPDSVADQEACHEQK
ncbi:threonine-phosphate decarboxylase [Larsenimonas rhizosphaerae]|uniref:threonine-phosphate decarboxylase n=1 Tax=Larsenimonas rhizosphaerae TaxID=2944682 RepID=UPI00203491DC|nr:pyridoxal phosphate-dependent class II aminotransferase [Larsenimonas rhizosphaerae]